MDAHSCIPILEDGVRQLFSNLVTTEFRPIAQNYQRAFSAKMALEAPAFLLILFCGKLVMICWGEGG